jgi:exopolyphosphatase/pppGpp-phosphohydrolase
MHRRKLHPAVLERNPYWVVKLGILLRLAAVVHRHRSRATAPVLTARMLDHGKPATIELVIDEAYLVEHPLTKLDLENEVSLLAAIDIRFSLRLD